MSELWVGGPDCPPRALRDHLQQRIDRVPPGGEIDWATYYFRDRALARALIAASDRGVRVTLQLEGLPRRKSANEAVLSLLSAHGLRGGLHIHRPGNALGGIHPHLHTKIYVFSGPEPAAFVGSFNPSGDQPEDPDVIAEIGDQDRGHNILVGYRQPALVAALRHHVRSIRGSADRFRPGRTVRAGATTLFFYPRLLPGVIDRQLRRLGAGARLRGAVSHLKQGSLTRHLERAAARGAEIELLVHDTERRVPEAAIAALRAAGVKVRRYARPDGLPLHAKILLVSEPQQRTAWFGSFNYNPRSRYLNHELLVRSREEDLWATLSRRYDQIAAEIAEWES